MNEDIRHIYDASLFNISDLDVLLHEILKHTRELIKAEAGTIYIKDKDKLKFHVFQNDALSYEDIYKQHYNLQNLSLPVSESKDYLAVESLVTNKIIQIDDVYNSDEYDFAGVREFDKKFRYKTTSIITFPIIHPINYHLLGVVQLLNKKDKNGKAVAFEQKDKEMLSLISSFIALSISKAQDDIRRLKLLNEELEETNKNLEKRVKEEIEKNEKKSAQIFHQSKMVSMGEMIGNIAHQWRQPLSSISTIASGLQLDIEMENFEEKNSIRQLEQVINTTKYLSQTIDDFRSFYKIDKAKNYFSLYDSIEKAITLTTATLNDHNIKCEYNLDKSLIAYGYRNEFTQAVLNIIANAKDAIIENRLLDESRILLIDLVSKGDYSILKILDNGRGIIDEIKDKIFLQNFSTRSKKGGTGIGLYMTKQIVEDRMQGTIFVSNKTFTYQNEEQTGAQFTVKIPKY